MKIKMFITSPKEELLEGWGWGDQLKQMSKTLSVVKCRSVFPHLTYPYYFYEAEGRPDVYYKTLCVQGMADILPDIALLTASDVNHNTPIKLA